MAHFKPLHNFAESDTSRSTFPPVADVFPLTLWQLQYHCPILPLMERGSESRLCGVLALHGPGCCCCRGAVRLSKPEKLHGFGPAAAWDGSLSLQVWSCEWGMTAVFHSWPALSLPQPCYLFTLFLPLPPFAPLSSSNSLLSWEMAASLSLCGFSYSVLTSLSQSNANAFLNNHACVQIFVFHTPTCESVTECVCYWCRVLAFGYAW